MEIIILEIGRRKSTMVCNRVIVSEVIWTEAPSGGMDGRAAMRRLVSSSRSAKDDFPVSRTGFNAAANEGFNSPVRLSRLDEIFDIISTIS
jgi:hypothetical protein